MVLDVAALPGRKEIQNDDHGSDDIESRVDIVVQVHARTRDLCLDICQRISHVDEHEPDQRRHAIQEHTHGGFHIRVVLGPQKGSPSFGKPPV